MTSDHGHQPDAAYFETMARHARTHWWYEGRRALVHEALASATIPPGLVLDVGCGTGDNLDMLSAATGRAALGTDLSTDALQHARRGPAGGVRTVIALAEALPVADEVCGLVTSMDVVEHLDDDYRGLREYRRVLVSHGVLLLTVPAYQWLWGEHDVRAAHRRRYRLRGLVAVVEASGFEVLHTTYYNSFLVPAAAALRRTPLRRVVKETDEEVGNASPFVSGVMSRLSTIERRVAARRSVPFGLSILLVGRRSN
ncbi:MAG TPA: class I SAM-dependent methyltransferase [Acidimicrobiales bacterium]|nr:class I SAM-dependent methyltransferase [Acidimicrobiales bacterium]